MKIAVIGSGVSGIAAAKTLMKFGHEVVLFERSELAGGVWALTYPDVRLQNIGDHYRFTDFDWPFPHDQHPTADQVMRYIRAAIEHYRLDIRFRHNVTGLHETADGWMVDLETPEGKRSEAFGYVVAAAGHYTHEKTDIALPGRDSFKGQVITERDIRDLGVFDGKRVAVVGFGKSAIDMTVFAVGRATEVHHVFREPRWLMPKKMLGRHIAYVSTARMSTMYNASWVHPGKFEAMMHRRSPSTAKGYAATVGFLVRMQTGISALRFDRKARARMKLVNPKESVSMQLRGTLAPDTYYASVASGRIEPHHASAAGFSADALLLSDGTSVAADVVVIAIGFETPKLPFLPEAIRADIAANSDGVQLYRHVLHPHVPRLAFAGFAHNPFHIPGTEVSMVWLGAVLAGDIVLPSPEAMEASTVKVRDWKRANTLFEPTRAYWVSNRFHQYLDVLLMELGVKPNRKSNPLSEFFAAYAPEDYAGVFDEYRQKRGTPRPALPFDT
ncbi:MAG: NAD(P)-binding domain-containing protein [Devosia sp.]|nr:NAD(P)-binding domain-containing protein [Devosia sp.]